MLLIAIKGILPDVELRALSKFSKLEFLHIFVDLLQEAHFPKGVRLKSFQYEMRAIFTESLVHKALFNTVVYGSNETHIIMHNLKGKIGFN